MKHFIYIFAAALAVAACTREPAPSAPASEPVVFTAHAELNPGTKAILDLNGSSKPQTFWEDGDAINVFTSGDGDSQSGKGYQFTTSLGANATSATFSYAGGDFKSGSYYAIYPYTNKTRGVNFTGDDGTYRLAGTVIPNSQTLVAGSFDRTAGVAIAYSDGSTSLDFKNATALIKFRVADGDITGGWIEVDEADAITGTFMTQVNTSTRELALNTYAQGASYNVAEFTIDGSTPLSAGTDYYVAVRPTTLTSELRVYLNGNLVKTINNSQLAALQRNKVYNLGTLSSGTPAATKSLTFDFSVAPLAGWPTADNWDTKAGNLDCTYNLSGTDYHFLLTDAANATSARVAWDSSKGGLVWFNASRYLGLPALSGYRLREVSGVMCLSTKSTRKADVSRTVAAKSGDADNCVYGGSPMAWNTKGTTYTFRLKGTTADTRYYLACSAVSIGVSSLTLVYEEVE